MKNLSNFKQWLVLAGIFAIVVNFSAIRDRLSPTIDYDANVVGSVTLYGTEWCGYCKKARTMLRRHNIPFQDLDVESSDEANRQFQAIGGRGVPVITVGDQVVHGYNYARLRKLLEGEDST